MGGRERYVERATGHNQFCESLGTSRGPTLIAVAHLRTPTCPRLNENRQVDIAFRDSPRCSAGYLGEESTLLGDGNILRDGEICGQCMGGDTLGLSTRVVNATYCDRAGLRPFDTVVRRTLVEREIIKARP